jgi:hypothetical protein
MRNMDGREEGSMDGSGNDDGATSNAGAARGVAASMVVDLRVFNGAFTIEQQWGTSCDTGGAEEEQKEGRKRAAEEQRPGAAMEDAAGGVGRSWQVLHCDEASGMLRTLLCRGVVCLTASWQCGVRDRVPIAVRTSVGVTPSRRR